MISVRQPQARPGGGSPGIMPTTLDGGGTVVDVVDVLVELVGADGATEVDVDNAAVVRNPV